MQGSFSRAGITGSGVVFLLLRELMTRHDNAESILERNVLKKITDFDGS